MIPILSFVISLVYSFNCFANSNEIESYLERYRMDPINSSKELPMKKILLKNKNHHPLIFSKQDILYKKFILAKDEFRLNKICSDGLGGDSCQIKDEFIPWSLFDDQWQLAQFINEPYDLNIFNLSIWDSGVSATMPWSGHYWPLSQGGIGARYGDAVYPQSEDFKINYDYYIKNYLQPVGADPIILDKLSPAEKYDLIIGDNDWNLTKSSWASGKEFYDTDGKVDSWMGLCHGWAPASYLIPEPKKTIDYDLQGGRGIMKIFPHDIKGLYTQLWSELQFSYEYLGGRCNDKNPKLDSAGRIKSEDCFDINPMAWHLALTQWVGRLKKSFVFDAVYDYEVWNQPIYAYSIKYYNPESNKVGTLQESVIPYKTFKGDNFKKYRPHKTSFIVGVTSEVQYVAEEQPYQGDSVTNPMNQVVTVLYIYDLELDENYNIIGGEWYQQAHPDMVWKPKEGTVVSVSGEEMVSNWNGTWPLSLDLFNLGVKSSQQRLPLSKLLNQLLNWSLVY